MKKSRMYTDLHMQVLKDIRANEFYLNDLELESLVKEFSNTFIDANENPLASQTIRRMIVFYNEQKERQANG